MRLHASLFSGGINVDVLDITAKWTTAGCVGYECCDSGWRLSLPEKLLRW